MSKYTDMSTIFKAFCDENRLMILEKLQTGEKCTCELLEDFDLAQSTLSHHMKILTESGLVKGRREGKWTHYSFDEEGIKRARLTLEMITTVVDSLD